MIGIVLAGGTGSRLSPLTRSFSKQLLPVFDKPMVFYPLATLMLAGIREIAIVTTPRDKELFQNLLGNGKNLGVELNYIEQQEPKGIADVFRLCEKFIGNQMTSLILGDNIFHGNGLGSYLQTYTFFEKGAVIFGYAVANPQDYGVVTVNSSNEVMSITEKPTSPQSNLVVPGLYMYDNQVVEISKALSPSSRGELEITDVNKTYLSLGLLHFAQMPRGTAWFDTGTFENLADASTYIRVLQARQGTRIACLEEIAWRNKWISDDDLLELASSGGANNEKDYLRSLLYSKQL